MVFEVLSPPVGFEPAPGEDAPGEEEEAECGLAQLIGGGVGVAEGVEGGLQQDAVPEDEEGQAVAGTAGRGDRGRI